MFSQRLKELRKEKKISQLELSKALSVDRTTVMKWETGKAETSFAMLIKIADYFEVTVDFLLGRKDF